MKHYKKQFSTYQEMSESAINWKMQCAYYLTPEAMNGEHQAIELLHTQLSYSHRKGGFMHNAFSPKNTLSIAVIKSCKAKACFDTIKLYSRLLLKPKEISR